MFETIQPPLQPPLVKSNIPFLHTTNYFDSTLYSSEYATKFTASFPSRPPPTTEPGDAQILSTDRQFLVYWKSSSSHESHVNPQVHLQEKTLSCCPKENNTTYYGDPRKSNFINDSTTYKDTFQMFPLQEKHKIKIPTSSIPFDNKEFYKLPQTSNKRDYQQHSNAEIAKPFLNLKTFPSPIYKDYKFDWLKTETNEKFNNPKIYPINKEDKKIVKKVDYPKSTNVIGQINRKDDVNPKSEYSDYYTTKPISKSYEGINREKLILGDNRLSCNQWEKSLVHEDFQYVRGDKAVPSKQYPFRLGHPNYATDVDYKSSTISDDYKAHGKQKASEINPDFTHYLSHIDMACSGCKKTPTTTYQDLFCPWPKGDTSERVCYPKWQLGNSEEKMSSETEFCKAYGDSFYKIPVQPGFGDETHIKSEDNKHICEDGTTYKDNFKWHEVGLPYNCTCLKQQDKCSIKIPYFNKVQQSTTKYNKI